MLPFFSIIIPCHNVAHSVMGTLNSVAAQNERAFEVIAVNDGSSDTTLHVLESFNASFPFVIIDQKNKGLGGARNAGVTVAHGEFLAFLDADDLWEPEKLERVRETLHETGADLVCHDEYFVRAGTTVRNHRYGPRTKYLDLLFHGNCLSPSAVTVRRDAVVSLGGFSEDRRGHGVEDYGLWMRLARVGRKFYYLHESLGSYVLHDANMSAGPDFQECERFILEQHFSHLDATNPALARKISKRRALNDACAGWSRFQRGQWVAAFGDYQRALRGDFFGTTVWKYMAIGTFREIIRQTSTKLGKPKGTPA